jgi:hypothetical protein
MPKEKVKQFGAQTLFGRAAQPAELAPIFVFLASDQATYVTGEVYGATGGQICSDPPPKESLKTGVRTTLERCDQYLTNPPSASVGEC